MSGNAAGFRIVPAPKTEASSVGNQSMPVLSHKVALPTTVCASKPGHGRQPRYKKCLIQAFKSTPAQALTYLPVYNTQEQSSIKN